MSRPRGKKRENSQDDRTTNWAQKIKELLTQGGQKWFKDNKIHK